MNLVLEGILVGDQVHVPQEMDSSLTTLNISSSWLIVEEERGNILKVLQGKDSNSQSVESCELLENLETVRKGKVRLFLSQRLLEWVRKSMPFSRS